MLRWQLSGNALSQEEHDYLERLTSNLAELTPDDIRPLRAPGLVTSMTVTQAQRITLPAGLTALSIRARYLPLKGEEPLLRHILLFSDRQIIGKQIAYFRESLQFVATENSFSTCEQAAYASMLTFRREAFSTAYKKGYVSGKHMCTSGPSMR